jgi:eukaryotic-like serine/threonine-protein kinase
VSNEVDAPVEDRHLQQAIRARLFGERGPAVRIGKYLIDRPVGSGAAGHVFAARDPDLERTVAIKLLREAGPVPDSGGTARLLREARALASVVHPNVVQIFDAGVHDGTVYLVCELVTGGTLRHWQSDPRPWRRVLEIYRGAGLGLSAVHAASIVHRDFKPDNVVLTVDGSPKVTDFGLAKFATGPVETDRIDGGEADDSESGPDWDTKLSRTGAIVGTPRYMAPEIHDGSAPDPSADQFAFCVALFEALYGRPPFTGRSIAGLAAAARSGRIEPPPTRADAPAWLWEIVTRGLAVEPSARWPDMVALLEALRRGDRRRSWPWMAGAAGLATGAVLLSAWPSAGPPSPCPAEVERWRSTWDDDRAEAVRQGFANSGIPGAAAAEPVVRGTLDRYVAEASALLAATCPPSGEGAPASELGFVCLRRSRVALETLVRLYAAGDRTSVERSLVSVRQLPPLWSCAEPGGLAEPRPADPDQASAVDRLRDDLLAAFMQAMASADGAAIEQIVRMREDAARVGYAPFRAEVEHRIGVARLAVEQREPGLRVLEQAFDAAAGGVHDAVAFLAAARLASESTQMAEQRRAAERWARHASSLVDRVGETADPLVASALHDLGTARSGLDDPEGARTLHLRAHEIRTMLRGPRHYEVGFSRLALAELDLSAGDATASLQGADLALEIFEEALGPGPPSAQARFLRARALDALGRSTEATSAALAAETSLRSFGLEDAADTVKHWVLQRGPADDAGSKIPP